MGVVLLLRGLASRARFGARTRVVLGAFALAITTALLLAATGCEQSKPSCEPGTLGCECMPSDACNSGLACLSSVCVGSIVSPDASVDGGSNCQPELIYPDRDGDGFGDSMGSLTACRTSGFVTRGGDCNDADDKINPDAVEECNGKDDDCSNTIDEGCDCGPSAEQACGVSDGHGGIVQKGVCKAGTQGCVDGMWGKCTVGTTRNAEICNALDDDCDGKVDETVTKRCWQDADQDGYAAIGASNKEICGECPAKYTAREPNKGNTDCNDSKPKLNPGVKDVCNGLDDDCDGDVDKDCPCTAGHEQACGATDGSGVLLMIGLCHPGTQTCVNGKITTCSGDVQPTDEVCDANNTDEDCDGQVDEKLLLRCWPDADGDDYAANGAVGADTCATACPKNQTAREPVGLDIDCDDATKTTFPTQTETCNTVDDDCDTKIDETVIVTYYQDLDGDGFGNSNVSKQACSTPAGYVTKGGDCRDDAAAIKPGATEICDAADNDCNGLSDDGINCSCTNGSTRPCGAPDGAGGIETRGNCEQGTSTCSGGMYSATCVGAVLPATEVCNGKNEDEDCDGKVDETLTTACWADADSDGFAPMSAATSNVCGSCGAKLTTLAPSAPNIDCNDAAASVKPGATEVCNGVDDNCTAGTDEGFGTGAACGQGACAGGHTECATTSTTRCSSQPGGSASLASAEKCDNVDNDCDGMKDNGNPGGGVACGMTQGVCKAGTTLCSGGGIVCSGQVTGSTEICDTLDNDCDGTPDDGFGTGVACGSGICSGGHIECATTSTTRCSTASLAVSEICDGKDNDCDGTPDDGFNLTTACGTGVCVGGHLECATTTTTRCSTQPGGSGSLAGAETCDGKDNDCNGTPDDGAALTSCGGTMVCLSGKCAACTPGKFQCTSATQSQKCDGTGVWNNDDQCVSTSAPPRICDTYSATTSATYGMCINNSPVPYGLNSASGLSVQKLGTNVLLAQPIIAADNVHLVAFGFLTAPSNKGGSVYLSLHTDTVNGAGDHEPLTLINNSDEVILPNTGLFSQNVTSPLFTQAAKVNLVKGTRYWIVANLDVLAGEDIESYVSSTANAAGVARTGARTYASPTNLVVGATSKATGALGLFINVQR